MISYSLCASPSRFRLRVYGSPHGALARREVCSLASNRRGQFFFVRYSCAVFTLVYTTDISPAQILASASYDDTIKLYIDDPSDDWFCATTLTGHTSTVWALAWEPMQGRYLASASDDTTIRLWRRVPGTGELKFDCVSVLEGHDRSIYSISWTPAPASDNQIEGDKNLGWLARTGADGYVCIWNIVVSLHLDIASTPSRHECSIGTEGSRQHDKRTTT